MKFVSKLLICLAALAAPAATARADVMTGTFNVFNSNISGAASANAALSGGSGSTTLIGLGETFTFDAVFTSAELVLTISANIGANAQTIWNFTGLSDSSMIDSVGLTPSSAGSSVDDSLIQSGTLMITTPSESTAPTSYTFNLLSSTTPVPEPGTFAAMLLGGVAFWGVRRRKAA